jgi:PAS domain S-box-containing protein
MPTLTFSRLHPYGVAVLSSSIALLLMLGLDPLAKMTQTPFLLFFGAVVISAWQAGIRSGIVATGLSALMSNFFFMQARYTFTLGLPNQIRLSVFILECILISILCGSLRTTNQKLDRSLLKLKAGEESLRTANQHITEILESITDGFYTLNRQWQFVYLNHQAEEILRRTREELLGQSIWQIFPTARESMIGKSLQQAMSEQIPVVIESVGIVNPQRWFEVHVNPLQDGLAVYFQDVTERKQAEQALRESEALAQARAEELATFMEVVPVAVWIARDPLCSEMSANRAAYELMRATPGTPTTATPADQIYPFQFKIQNNGQDIPVNELSMQKAGRTGEEVVEEAALVFEDGVVHHIYGRAVPLWDDIGKVRGVIGAYLDITERKQAEVALQLSENRYRTLANAVSQLMWVNDPQGNIQFFNQRWQEYTGILDLELGVGLWPHVIHPDDFAPTLEAKNHAIQAGQAYEVECRLQRFDQTYRWHLARVVPLKDEQGQVINWFGTATDIHDVKQTEAALRASEAIATARAEELEIFMETVPAAVWIAHDPQCHFMSANRAAYQLVQLPPGSISTATPADGSYPFPFKIQRKGQDAPLHELPMQQAGQTGQEVEAEFDFVFETGQVRSIWGRAVPLRNEAGEVRGVIGAFLDISERKRAEEELREREYRFSTLFNGMEDWVVVYHLTNDHLPGKIIEVNEQACKKLGYSRDELLQMSVTDIVCSVLLNPKTHSEHLLNQKHRVVESVHRTKEGLCIPCEVSATLFTLNGLPTVQFICRDITERKQIEAEREHLLACEQAAREAAETANRIKDEFLAVLSHELRSPLNPILGWTRLLQTRKLDEQATHRALDIIERNVRLQTQLIEDLLDVSRILRGKMVLNTAPVNLVTTIEAALETVHLAAEAKGIEIHTILASNIGYVAGDAGRLQQILWNLISNAVKFTPAGGRIEIRLEPVDSQAQIQVQDTGKGITPAFLPHVFEYFRQEDGTTTRQFGGLGLGLAIVRHLTELHGGTIHAESAGEGLGATFILRLPLMTTPPQVIGRQPASVPSSTLSDLQVLVVDDEADMRELVLNILRHYDIEVRVAASAAEALFLFKQFQPDVLVSDIGMPEVDGYMLMQKVRKLPPEKGGLTPAIALTAYAGELDQKQALASGFQLHIPKPVEPDELIRAILSVVSV